MKQLSTATRVRVIAALVEGNSINSTVRMVGVSKPTILKLLADIGEACQKFHGNRVVGLTSKRLQCDEIWCFCHSRTANVRPENIGKFGHGDVWNWTCIDADTKLMVAWHVGLRTTNDAIVFMNDVSHRLANKVQLTTDGLGLYIDGVLSAFDDVDFGQLIKVYGKDPSDRMSRFNPSICLGATPTPRFGNPDINHISTSFVERQNLTMRMGMRRFTRLTNGHSKKIENHAHMVALFFTYYNFCRVHSTVKTTPAVAAGIADRVWRIDDLVALIG